MPHLRSVTFNAPLGTRATRFPFTIPAVQSLVGRTLAFTTPVTLLVGENGSGKSTVLEALARAIGSITVGSHQVGDYTPAKVRAGAGNERRDAFVFRTTLDANVM
jgi:predicted ATPase